MELKDKLKLLGLFGLSALCMFDHTLHPLTKVIGVFLLGGVGGWVIYKGGSK